MKNRIIIFLVALCLILNTVEMVNAEELPSDPAPPAETTDAAEPAPDASGANTDGQAADNSADVSESQPGIDQNAPPLEGNETIEAQPGISGDIDDSSEIDADQIPLSGEIVTDVSSDDVAESQPGVDQNGSLPEGNETAEAQPDTSAGTEDSPAIDANGIPLSGEIATDDAIEPNDIAGAAAQGAAQKASISLAPSSANLGSAETGKAIIIPNAVTLTVISGKNRWNVTVSSGNFTSGSLTIPPERISVKLSTSSTWIPLTSTQTTLLSNQPTTNGISINLDYKLELLPTDPIGLNYAGSITYNIIPI